MGGYCFKIIACGTNSESPDTDNQNNENKGLSDKRGWSFRKRSSGHRVLSNTVIAEVSSSYVNKSEEQPPVIGFSGNEETYVKQRTEELPRVSSSTTKGKGDTLSKLVMQAAAEEEDIDVGYSFDESSVVVIQAAVRKYLAQREMLRQKKVVKLQAAVRGHLVRCRAAGSLRCIQAIFKMQALVRARNAKMSVVKEHQGVQDSRTRPHPTYISIGKLLSNPFAIQLLDSTPRTKQINMKCSPSNDDSAWKWLERWTSVSSPQVMESHASNHQHDKVIDTKKQIQNMVIEEKPDFLSDESKHFNDGLEIGPEQPKRHEKRTAAEQAASESKKSVFGSRKVSNPTFIAAHSRFEELTSKNNSFTSVGSSNKEQSKGSLVYESLKVDQSRALGSECGTELSVTSMLDSPDQSEAANVEYVKEAKHLDKELTHSTLDPLEKYETQIHHQVNKLSQEASPRSHVTVQESNGTPSNQMSNNNKTRSDRSVSSQTSKSKSLSNSKKSPVSSGLRNSLDNLDKERKPTRRRNSFGSQSSDQEPRDSSGSNYIPSYMQVTESARAKALVNNSPRSSPDVQGKGAYMKKRHSLPAAVTSRHGSPYVKRTSSEAQQTTKGNNNNNNSDRKWQN